jgi:peptidoglycan/LPS O-acetylase OafA/YrhL
MIRFSVPEPRREAGRERLRGIDALKGLAIILVVLYHAGGVLIWEDRLHGEVGVDIFLLLSGFLLSFGSSDSPWRDFLRRRFFRIFPTYWMALALFVVLGTAFLHLVFTPQDLLLHVLGLHATVRGAYFSDVNNSFWFITTIVFLYLVFLAVRRWARVLLVLGVGGLMTLLCLLPFPEFGNLSGRLLGFFLGICAGQLRRGGEIRLRLGFIFAAGAATFAALEWRGWTSFLYPLAAVAVVAVAVVLQQWLRPWRGGRLLLAPIEFVGVYSYEIYLFHQPLIREYNYWFQRTYLRREPSHRELVGGMMLTFALTVGLSVAAAAATRRRRFQAWILALAGGALLAVAAGAGPLVARAGDRFVTATQPAIRPPPVVVEPGTTWKTAAPANRAFDGWSGPLRLVVVLSPGLDPIPQPLIVTGHTGQGDLLGLIRVDAQHVRFTCDHWGKYSLASPDILLGPGPQHTIDALLGSLLPAPGSPWSAAQAQFQPLTRRLYVAIDGREAFDREAEFHPAAPAEAFVGINPIGGSTTAPRFTGRILRIERLDPDLLPGKLAPAPGR